MEKKVAVIGLGKMGAAIARMLSKSDYEVIGYDVEEVRLPSKIEVVTDLHAIWNIKIPVIIAVKPAIVSKIAAAVPDDRLIMSIAAGVPVQAIEDSRQVSGPVIRVMPNVPLTVKEGISALCAGERAGEEDRAFALEVFMHGGDAFYLENENDMHAVTALSGSGPAFVELFMQTMEDTGVLLGLSRDISRRLSAATVQGTGRMVQKSSRSPQEFIHDVTSPGGTTAAGLQTLKDFGMERAIIRAIKRSARRSAELGSQTK